MAVGASIRAAEKPLCTSIQNSKTLSNARQLVSACDEEDYQRENETKYERAL